MPFLLCLKEINMKSLKIIQVLSKILWVITKVMFVVCIVGASCCLLSVIILPITQDILIYEDVTIRIFLEDKNVSVATAITACALGILTCGVGIALSKINEKFFKKELDLGTPFNKDIVKEMRILAIIHVAVAVTLGSIMALTLSIVRRASGEIIDIRNDFGSSFWFGVSLLVISLFCDYGAEKDHSEAVDVKDVESKEKKE